MRRAGCSRKLAASDKNTHTQTHTTPRRAAIAANARERCICQRIPACRCERANQIQSVHRRTNRKCGALRSPGAIDTPRHITIQTENGLGTLARESSPRLIERLYGASLAIIAAAYRDRQIEVRCVPRTLNYFRSIYLCKDRNLFRL